MSNSPERIAEYLVEDLKKSIGRKGSQEEMTDAIAAALSAKFPGATDDVVRQALLIASELIRADREFNRLNADTDWQRWPSAGRTV